jgi:hypothetical protein
MSVTIFDTLALTLMFRSTQQQQQKWKKKTDGGGGS